MLKKNKNFYYLIILICLFFAGFLIGNNFLNHNLTADELALDDQEATIRAIKKVIPAVVSIIVYDYDYIENQHEKLKGLVRQCNISQIKRIQDASSKTRLSILYYGLLENCLIISDQTLNLLNIFRESFKLHNGNSERKGPLKVVV